MEIYEKNRRIERILAVFSKFFLNWIVLLEKTEKSVSQENTCSKPETTEWYNGKRK